MNIEAIWQKWQTVLVAVSPAIGYALAYVHELGYYQFFCIPTEFIKLDWTTILIAIAASAAGLSLLSWFFIAVVTIKKKKLAFILLMCLWLIFFSIRYLTGEESLILGIMLLAMLFVLLVIPWYRRTYQRNLADEFKINMQVNKNDPFIKWLNSDKMKYVSLIVWIVILVFGLSYMDGRSAAMNKSTFYIPSSNPQAVVLKINGNELICAPRILGTRYFQQTYFVLKIDDPKLSISANQNLGHLRAFGKEY